MYVCRVDQETCPHGKLKGKEFLILPRFASGPPAPDRANPDHQIRPVEEAIVAGRSVPICDLVPADRNRLTAEQMASGVLAGTIVINEWKYRASGGEAAPTITWTSTAGAVRRKPAAKSAPAALPPTDPPKP